MYLFNTYLQTKQFFTNKDIFMQVNVVKQQN